MAYIVWGRCSNPWEAACNSRKAVDEAEREVWDRELVTCPESAPPQLGSAGRASAPPPLQKLGRSAVGLHGLALAGYPLRR
jgi:hypothetical protein